MLKMIAEAFKQFCVSVRKKWNIMWLGSVVLMKLGRSLSLMFFMPGIQSTGVSRVPSLMKVSSGKTHISLLGDEHKCCNCMTVRVW